MTDSMQEERVVALLPRIDLHTGYHGAVLGNPPPGYRYRVEDADHVFVYAEGGSGDSPFETLHLAEMIETKGGQDLVHTARWPVLGASAWVADTDDLLYPIICGRTALSASFRKALRKGGEDTLAAVRQRAENMLSGYLHPSCAGVLLRGRVESSLSVARQWFEHLNLTALGEAYLRKVIPIRPAQQSMNALAVQAKWSCAIPLRVVFCGRDFEGKNGLMALQVMARIRAHRGDVHFVYVGPIPKSVLVERPGLLDGVSHYEHMSHPDLLAELLRSHVLFHPSQRESIGLVFLEAAAAGMAVVTARGDGMDYVDDLFAPAGGLLVDRHEVPSHEEATVFEKLVCDLLDSPLAARGMGLRNYEMTASGEYSVAGQVRTISAVYESAVKTKSAPLTLNDLPYVQPENIQRISSALVKNAERRTCERHGLSSLRLDI